jgi:hypothetical protein
VAGIPARVTAFVAWLQGHGEAVSEPVGNWYEVERASAAQHDGDRRRAGFSLDDLPPSEAELETWLRWAELAREDLASALDEHPGAASATAWLADQDLALAADLGADADGATVSDAIDRLYAARDALMSALATPGRDGARRALRLAIGDDLRLAERIRAG